MSLYGEGMKPLKVTRRPLPGDFQEAEIARVTSIIATAVEPCSIFCFGSAAAGRATDQSDLDFLVVVDDQRHFEVGRKKLRPFFPLSTLPVDLIWKTQAEFLRLRELGGISMVAWEQGVCTYCRAGLESGLSNDKEAKI